MEIFKHNIRFNSWGEIYAGLKRGYMGVDEISEFCQDGKIIVCNEERIIKLSVENYESLHNVFEFIRAFIIEDNHKAIPIVSYEEDKYPFKYIPTEYWEIWKLELLLKIMNRDITIEEQLRKAHYDVYVEFEYALEDAEFSFLGNRTGKGPNSLYRSLLSYVDNKIKYLQLLNKKTEEQYGCENA